MDGIRNKMFRRFMKLIQVMKVFRTGSSVASSSKMISFNCIWDPSGLKENSLGELVGDWAANTEIGSIGTDYLA